jgi:hypothetical protein
MFLPPLLKTTISTLQPSKAFPHINYKQEYYRSRRKQGGRILYTLV